MSLSSPSQIVEGTSSFELVGRVLSSFDLSRPLRILTTNSEFYSFERLIRRLQELPNITLVRVPTEPFNSFEERFCEKLKGQDYDLIVMPL